jgi:glycosyltransferase involved in cell wall biosynthesis
MKELTVILPVRNEAGQLRSLLAELSQQSLPAERYRLVVADGRSTDATRAIVREFQRTFPDLELCDNPERWSSAARNRGLLEAESRCVLIVDGHCAVRDRDFLWRHVQSFQRTGCMALGRPQPLEPAGAAVSEAVAVARCSGLGHNPASFVYANREAMVPPDSVAVAYRTAVVETIGLFDARFDACEDVHFNRRLRRAGHWCYFARQLRLIYRCRRSFAGLFQQMVRYGRGRARLLLRSPGGVSGPAAVGLLALSAVASALWLGGTLGLAALGALYLSAIVAAALVQAARRRSLPLALLLPVAYTVIHAGLMAGALVELCVTLAELCPRRRQ